MESLATFSITSLSTSSPISAFRFISTTYTDLRVWRRRSIWHPPFLELVLRKGEAESIGMHLERNLQLQISFHRLRKKPYEPVTRDA